MKKPKKIIQIITLFLLSFIITACGFQPRGNNTLPLALRVMSIKSNDPYGAFTKKLENSLQNVGVAIVPADASSKFILEIQTAHLQSSILSVGTGPQATVYLVTYIARIVLYDAKGKTIIAPQDIMARSTMTVTAQQTLSATNQLDTLEQTLQRDVIIQIFGVLTQTPIAAPAIKSHHVQKKVK